MSEQGDAGFIAGLAAEARAIAEAAAVWQRLDDAGLLNCFEVHEYRCASGNCGVVARVIRLRDVALDDVVFGDVVLMRTGDYVLRPHTNLRQSAPKAREKNTLNGSDHWPSRVYDVGHLAGQAPQEGGKPVYGDQVHIAINCRHGQWHVAAAEVLSIVRDARPGKPGKPTILP